MKVILDLDIDSANLLVSALIAKANDEENARVNLFDSETLKAKALERELKLEAMLDSVMTQVPFKT